MLRDYHEIMGIESWNLETNHLTHFNAPVVQSRGEFDVMNNAHFCGKLKLIFIRHHKYLIDFLDLWITVILHIKHTDYKDKKKIRFYGHYSLHCVFAHSLQI